MTDTAQTRPTIAWRIWITIRFIVFGVGGFLVVWNSWIYLLFEVMDPPSERWLSARIGVPLGVVVCLLGALMVLFGVGQWGRWAYLWVFISVPLAISSLGFLAGRYPQFDTLFAKPALLLLIVFPMPVSYLLVRRYYRRREAEATKAST